jgi:hypothetical protein
MFTTILGDLKGYFGKAFIMSVWLPVAVFISGLAAVIAPGTAFMQAIQTAGTEADLKETSLLAIALFLAVTLIAYIIQQLQVPITQFFEGYWDKWPILNRWGNARKKRYLGQLTVLNNRINYLDEQIPLEEMEGRPSDDLKVELNRLAEKRLLGFPLPGDEAHVMPTRLGNIFKTAELYPYRRYGIDAVIFWPRLHSFISTELLERLQESRIAVNFLLLSAILMELFSLVCLPYLILTGAAWPWWLASAAGFPLGWLAYRLSLTPALAYGELIKTAFDLHRRHLLESLGLVLPTQPAQEKKLWRDLGNFIFRNSELPAKTRYSKKTKSA